MKRTFDVFGALMLLVVAALPMVLIAVAIGLSGGGPIIFRQRRIGLFGETFCILKFRTMTVMEQDCRAQDLVKDGCDPRVTDIGRILRKTHLDELPQIFNVLLGDMSLVGPRPIVPSIAKEYEEQSPESAIRYSVKPGLTGPAQVFGRKLVLVNLPVCLQLDVEYAAIKEGWSLILKDIHILWATIFVVLSGQGV